jgi:hypothetical protein
MANADSSFSYFAYLKVIFPSFGERYLTTALFNSIYEEVQQM